MHGDAQLLIHDTPDEVMKSLAGDEKDFQQTCHNWVLGTMKTKGRYKIADPLWTPPDQEGTAEGGGD